MKPADKLHTLKVFLTGEMLSALTDHAAVSKLSLEEDLISEWWGRRRALLAYAEKRRAATEGASVAFRVYGPRSQGPATRMGGKVATEVKRKASSIQRTKVTPAEVPAPVKTKPAVVSPSKPGVKPVRILPDDSPEVACDKADAIEDAGSELSGAEILKKFGRDARGRKL